MLVLSFIKNTKLRYIVLILFYIVFGSSIAEARDSDKSSIMETRRRVEKRRHDRVANIARRRAEAVAEKEKQDEKIAEVKKTMSSFFDDLQDDSIRFFNKSNRDLQSLKSCMEENNCSLFKDIRLLLGEYRVYTGLKNFEMLRKSLIYHRHTSRAKLRHNRHAVDVEFEWESDEGKKEIDLILRKVAIYEQNLSDLSEGRIKPRTLKSRYHRDMAFTERKLFSRLSKQSDAYYGQIISEYTAKYPFFIYLAKRNPSRGEIIKAIEKTIDNNKTVLNDIQSLKGEARIELLGFMKAVSLTMSRYTDEVAKEINDAFHFIQDQKTIMARVKEIVTNSQTRWMIACYTLVNYGAALSQIRVLQLMRTTYVQIGVMAVGLACGAYGAATTVSGVIKLTKDLMKHTRYADTGSHDEETYQRYLASYAVSLTLAYIWLRPGLPNLGKRSVGIWKKYKASKRLKRMRVKIRKKIEKDSNKTNGLVADVTSDVSEQWVTKTTNQLILEEAHLFKKYASYYAKDMSLRKVALKKLALKQSSDSFRSLIPVAMNKSWDNELQVLSFGEVISLSKNLGIEDL